MKFNPEQLVTEHGDYLYRYALSRLLDPATAEEVVQETFFSALKSRESFEGKSTLRTWLVGILKHKIIDHIRKASKERPYETPDELAGVEEEVFNPSGGWKMEPLKWYADPGMIREKREFWEVFRHCMSLLPVRQRNLFVLREMEGKSSHEICMLMSITPTNLWVILHRARLSLRACLEKMWFMEKKGGSKQ